MDFDGIRTTQPSSPVVRGIAQGAVGAGQVVSVKLNGITRSCRAARGLTTAAGDNVLGLHVNNEVIIFANLLAAAGAISPSGEAVPDPTPPIVYGQTVIQPTETATWTANKGWLASDDDVQQGSYGSSGDMRGVAFYGTKPASLAGVTVLSATLWLRRLTGDASAVTLLPVTQSTRPAGSPTMPGSPAPLTSPALPYRQNVKWDLPAAFPQALLDGTIGGFGIKSTGGPFVRLAGRQQWAAAFTLVVDWER